MCKKETWKYQLQRHWYMNCNKLVLFLGNLKSNAHELNTIRRCGCVRWWCNDRLHSCYGTFSETGITSQSRDAMKEEKCWKLNFEINIAYSGCERKTFVFHRVLMSILRAHYPDSNLSDPKKLMLDGRSKYFSSSWTKVGYLIVWNVKRIPTFWHQIMFADIRKAEV